MNVLSVKRVNDFRNEPLLNIVSLQLDSLAKQKLTFTPWPVFSYKPDVYFSIAHNSTHILLKYFVEEKTIRAVNTLTNSAVWEDSCVEFFISFNKGVSYYNVEFNCIGTGLIGYGKSKTDRELLLPDVVSQVKSMAVTIPSNNNNICWQLTLTIPVEVFIYTAISSLKQTDCIANFYKCGDLLPDPHFVAWSNIQSVEPNFHLPEFFGKLVFE